MTVTLSKLATLASNAALGPGYLFYGNTHLAVTRGGIRVRLLDENRNIPFDGKMADVQGLDWKVFSGCELTGTMVFQADVLTHIGFDSGSTSGNVTLSLKPKPAGVLLDDDDYEEDLRLYFPGTGAQIRFPVALATFSELQTTDREEVVASFTIAARATTATAAGTGPGTAPWVVEKLSSFS